jgi:hypothetical protein
MGSGWGRPQCPRAAETPEASSLDGNDSSRARAGLEIESGRARERSDSLMNATERGQVHGLDLSFQIAELGHVHCETDEPGFARHGVRIERAQRVVVAAVFSESVVTMQESGFLVRVPGERDACAEVASIAGAVEVLSDSGDNQVHIHHHASGEREDARPVSACLVRIDLALAYTELSDRFAVALDFSEEGRRVPVCDVQNEGAIVGAGPFELSGTETIHGDFGDPVVGREPEFSASHVEKLNLLTGIGRFPRFGGGHQCRVDLAGPLKGVDDLEGFFCLRRAGTDSENDERNEKCFEVFHDLSLVVGAQVLSHTSFPLPRSSR